MNLGLMTRRGLSSFILLNFNIIKGIAMKIINEPTTFLFRLSKEILSFLFMQVPLQLLGALVLLIWVPIQFRLLPQSPTKSPKLPMILRWFDCADLYEEFGRTPVTYVCTVVPQGWWAVYCWLAWRNPCNYFEYKYLGYQFKGTETYLISGSLDVGDSTNDEPGLKVIELVDSKGKVLCYEYYYIKKWSQKTCLRFRMGHKIGDMQNPKGTYSQHVFVVAPYKSYSGK